VSDHLGADPGTGPSGPRPPRRALLTAAAVTLFVAGLATSAIASGLRDDDAEEATGTGSGDGDKTEQTTSTSGDGGDETTTSGGIDLGDIDLGDIGGSGEASEPLPGDDWNDDARTQFVAECQSGPNVGTAASAAQMSAEELCACTYDTVEESGAVTFEQFNEDYSAATVDPSSPGTVAMQGAMFECAGL
jgi:hypothetical protein